MDAKRAHLDAVKKAGLTGQAANTDRNKAPGMGRRVPVAAAATGGLRHVPPAFTARHLPGGTAAPGEYELPEADLETDAPPVDITGTDGD